LGAQGPIDRTPGRLVVSALMCLYAWFALSVAGFAFEFSAMGKLLQALAGLAELACPLLILAAIVMRLGAEP
jgi:hypothetical protein